MAYLSKKHDVNNLNASIYLKLDLPLGFSLQTTYSPRFECIINQPIIRILATKEDSLNVMA